MSAETLRKAAALMRERAEAATPGRWHEDGPWWYHDEAVGMVTATVEDRFAVAVAPPRHSRPLGENGDADMRHIASWHPAVALAVADWLDAKAEQDDKGTCDGAGTVGVCNLCEHDYGHIAALAVARTYLGGA